MVELNHDRLIVATSKHLDIPRLTNDNQGYYIWARVKGDFKTGSDIDLIAYVEDLA